MDVKVKPMQMPTGAHASGTMVFTGSMGVSKSTPDRSQLLYQQTFQQQYAQALQQRQQLMGSGGSMYTVVTFPQNPGQYTGSSMTPEMISEMQRKQYEAFQTLQMQQMQQQKQQGQDETPMKTLTYEEYTKLMNAQAPFS